MNKDLFVYRRLLNVLAPLILIFNAWQAARAGESRLFLQRLGLKLPHHDEQPLWLHAASVGELIAAQPLIVSLRERLPHIPIVVTTITHTGAQLAKQRLPIDVQHVYLPVDWPGATVRFLRAINPRAALIMETELWPNLFSNVAQRNIPLIIVNGRLSNRSRNTANWIKRLYAVALNNVTAILARSTDDADAYIQLGASSNKVQTLGNIKLASGSNTKVVAINLDRSYVLAASTHSNEEQQIAQLWQQMGSKTQKRLLVIAPRHPQRREEILKQLDDQFTKQQIAVRSRDDAISADTQIYLADTLGELESFMAGADCVFMGGSLIPHGGQNILEPARLGRPIVFGPHMHNFAEETELLLQADGAKQVTDTQALSDVLSSWLAQPQTATEFGQKAAHVLSKQSSVLDDYLQTITALCKLDQKE